MRQTLYDGEELRVAFEIDEETDRAFVDLRSSEAGPDLSVEGAVAVAIGGTVAELRVREPTRARAALGTWPDLEREGLDLMIRVGEWFEQWELE